MLQLSTFFKEASTFLFISNRIKQHFSKNEENICATFCFSFPVLRSLSFTVPKQICPFQIHENYPFTLLNTFQ